VLYTILLLCKSMIICVPNRLNINTRYMYYNN
jgi:hypothetical protein